ncbi:MAG: tetratricopeptide repeat protein [Ignavibacteriales bacterium]|nr:tetratricopeptide repeat protein [Ignavibacteriales bacterium]
MGIIIIYGIITFNYTAVFEDPISHWSEAIKKSPKSADAYFNLGRVTSEVGKNIDKAIGCYQKGIELNDKNSKYHYNLGLLYLQKSQNELARIEFERSTELDSTNKIAQYNLGSLYLLNNRFKDAEVRMLKVINLDKDFIYAEMRLVEIYSRMGNQSSANYYTARLKNAGYQLKPTEKINKGV